MKKQEKEPLWARLLGTSIGVALNGVILAGGISLLGLGAPVALGVATVAVAGLGIVGNVLRLGVESKSEQKPNIIRAIYSWGKLGLIATTAALMFTMGGPFALGVTLAVMAGLAFVPKALGLATLPILPIALTGLGIAELSHKMQNNNTKSKTPEINKEINNSDPDINYNISNDSLTETKSNTKDNSISNDTVILSKVDTKNLTAPTNNYAPVTTKTPTKPDIKK